MDDDEEREPYLEQVIVETIGPLAGLFTPEELEALRRTLRDQVKDDPDLAKLHRAARPRAAPARTQKEAIDPRAEAPREGTSVVPLRRKGGAA